MGDRQNGRKKNNTSKNTAVAVIIAVAAILVIIAAGIFFLQGNDKDEGTDQEGQSQADSSEAQKNYEELQETVVTDSDDPLQRKIDFASLKEVNPDVYAWIWIPGTNIDYPILQSTTEPDDYYLNTTIDGKEGYPGSIYTEKYNSQAFTDPITVIYGHDMKDGTMFTELHKYEDKAFFDSNPYVYIYLPDQTVRYRIFAAVAFDDRYILSNYNYFQEEDFQLYLDDIRGSIEGNVNRDIEVTRQKRIIVLSTCISESPDQRWLVNATME